jgi:hypothetical protein
VKLATSVAALALAISTGQVRVAQCELTVSQSLDFLDFNNRDRGCGCCGGHAGGSIHERAVSG